jgi:putative PIN family toxin of toxin-antitoxin system
VPDKKPRVVFDCLVFLKGLLSKSGPAVSCLRLFEEGKVSLIVSKEILIEIQDVLLRSFLRGKYPRLTEDRVEHLLEVLRTRAEIFPEVPQHFRYERDPGDEPYINLNPRVTEKGCNPSS